MKTNHSSFGPVPIQVRWIDGAEPFDQEVLHRAIDRLWAERDTGGAGFLFLPWKRQDVDLVLETARQFRKRFRKLLVLGIGGSALGTLAALGALRPYRAPDREVRVLPNLDPQTLGEVLEWFEPGETALNVVSKSGSTVETLTQLALFGARLDGLGPDALRQTLVLTTDPTMGPLRGLAKQLGCASLPIPPDVGGRFSVLSAVGLFPLAFAGYDVTSMLDGASRVLCQDASAVYSSAVALSAWGHYQATRAGAAERVLWCYSDRLFLFADWFCQLWGESLGKRGPEGQREGQMPVKAMGTMDQHSLLQHFIEGRGERTFTFLWVDGPSHVVNVPAQSRLVGAFPELEGMDVRRVFRALMEGTMAALREGGSAVQLMEIGFLDEYAVGALFAHFELETAIAGYLLGIDPFDQPGVELAKKFAKGLLGHDGLQEYAARAHRVLGMKGGA